MKNLCDMHTHTVLSGHGYSSLSENILYASDLGLKYLGVSDHQPDEADVGAKKDAFNALEHCPESWKGVRIYRGCEFNILEGGIIDPMGIETSRLDFGIASLHSYAYLGSRDKMIITDCYLKVLDLDYITILGHIDDGSFKPDYEEVIRKAKENHKLIELNNSSLYRDTSRKNTKENLKTIIGLCIQYDQPIIIDSDAHICFEIGNFELMEEFISKTELPKKLIVNQSEELIREYFEKN